MNFEEWFNSKYGRTTMIPDVDMEDFAECWQKSRKELAREILAEAKFYRLKVSAEKCLNDTIERLEKEAKKL